MIKILLFAFVAQCLGIVTDVPCYSRFEYEFNVLQDLILLKLGKENLTNTVDALQNLISSISMQQQAQSQRLISLEQNVRRLRKQGIGGGTTYVRWGRTVCPNDTDLVYEGYAAGAHYQHSGSGTNFLCLPKDPLWKPDVTNGNRGLLYGAEYEVPINNLQDHDVPCAVCRTANTNVLMIPGRDQCYANWHLEYQGFLMTEYYGHNAKEFICVDADAETVNSGLSNQNGALLYLVEGKCGSLKCPPYIEGREITCTVCSYAPSE